MFSRKSLQPPARITLRDDFSRDQQPGHLRLRHIRDQQIRRGQRGECRRRSFSQINRGQPVPERRVSIQQILHLPPARFQSEAANAGAAGSKPAAMTAVPASEPCTARRTDSFRPTILRVAFLLAGFLATVLMTSNQAAPHRFGKSEQSATASQACSYASPSQSSAPSSISAPASSRKRPY